MIVCLPGFTPARETLNVRSAVIPIMLTIDALSRKMCQWPQPATSRLPKRAAERWKFLTATVTGKLPDSVVPLFGETLRIDGLPSFAGAIVGSSFVGR